MELGQRESPEQRGQILATGQRVRFSFCVLAGLIQTVLLNGPTTNDSSCPQSVTQCWSWGLTINQYYALLFVIVLVLTIPILWLKELDPPLSKQEETVGKGAVRYINEEQIMDTVELEMKDGFSSYPKDDGKDSSDPETFPTDPPMKSTLATADLLAAHSTKLSFSFFFNEVWLTLQNLTTLYLLIFVIGTQCFTNFTSNANIYLQYYVIKLTNMQAGIDTMTTFLALVIAIWIFQKYLIRRNWRYTQYGATTVGAVLGLVWIAAYYDAGGTQDPWFTIFIDVDTVSSHKKHFKAIVVVVFGGCSSRK